MDGEIIARAIGGVRQHAGPCYFFRRERDTRQLAVDRGVIASELQLHFFFAFLLESRIGKNLCGHAITKQSVANLRIDKAGFGRGTRAGCVRRACGCRRDAGAPRSVGCESEQFLVAQFLKEWLFELRKIISAGNCFRSWQIEGEEVRLRHAATFGVMNGHLFGFRQGAVVYDHHGRAGILGNSPWR